MSKDRLNVVARLRRFAERDSQVDLADAQRRLGAARERLEVLRKPSYAGEGTELTAAHLMALRAQGIIAAEELAEAREAWVRCEHHVREARYALQSATAKRRASDELIEKRRLANAAIAARAAQSALDEVVLMRRTRDRVR